MTDLENRKAFEMWYVDSYKNTDLGVLMSNGQYSSLRKQHSWDAWQASTQREGFKFVPLEPTLSMIEAAAEEHVTNGASYKTMFKAMINVV